MIRRFDTNEFKLLLSFRWAIEFAKGFSVQNRVSIIYPDQAELDDAIKYVDMGPNSANPFPNITLATIRTDRYCSEFLATVNRIILYL